MDSQVIKEIGFIAAIVLPLWNVPLMVRMIKRKSSQDISLYWVFGVWFTLLAMLPSGLVSQDIVWKAFNIINSVLFTCVVITACLYRKKNWGGRPNPTSTLRGSRFWNIKELGLGVATTFWPSGAGGVAAGE